MLSGRSRTALDLGAGAMNGDFEIDLTVDPPDDLLPIRWVGLADHANGHNGNAGMRHGLARLDTVIEAPPPPEPSVVTVASLRPRTPAQWPEPPTITFRELQPWYDAQTPATLRDVMTSRGARFLTVVVVVAFASLLAATVLLWQRVEDNRRVDTTAQPAVSTPSPAVLRSLQSRLNRVETRLSALLTSDGTTVMSSPSAMQSDLDALRYCLRVFQQQILNPRTTTINLC
jgi:hypothetical protein